MKAGLIPHLDTTDLTPLAAARKTLAEADGELRRVLEALALEVHAETVMASEKVRVALAACAEATLILERALVVGPVRSPES